MAHGMTQAAADGREEQLVVFRLAGEHYGLDIGSVQEIIVWQPVTRVPRAPGFVEGIINLRGNVIPVVDLRRRFGLEGAEPGRQTRIMVVEIGSLVVGLVVDGVSEVLRVPASAVEPPSAVISGVDTQFIRGVAKVGERLIILLNPYRILDDREQAALEAVEVPA
jgi:purine-binding chemotaxis protein CheW